MIYPGMLIENFSKLLISNVHLADVNITQYNVTKIGIKNQW